MARGSAHDLPPNEGTRRVSGTTLRSAVVAPFLVVEDDNDVARAIARFLSRYGEVVIATTFDEGILAAARVWIGMIIDVGLPGGSGLDVLKRARVMNPTAYAMLLTGNGDEAVYTASVKLRAQYVPKPCDLNTLQTFAQECAARLDDNGRVVAKLIDQWAKRHQWRESEIEIVRLAVTGVDRDEICKARDITHATLQTQISALASRTELRYLDRIVAAILREALVIIAARLA